MLYTVDNTGCSEANLPDFVREACLFCLAMLSLRLSTLLALLSVIAVRSLLAELRVALLRIADGDITCVPLGTTCVLAVLKSTDFALLFFLSAGNSLYFGVEVEEAAFFTASALSICL